MTNDDTASAPPAPTPKAGSDLDGLQVRNPAPNAAAPAVPGPGYRVMPAAHVTGFAPYTPITVGTGTVATDQFPPPGEDLAGQGEPVAWAYEWQDVAGGWREYVSLYRPIEGPHASKHIRNIHPLYAAPAPSRPADREEIASAVAASIMGMDWAQARPQGYHGGDADEEDRRHGMIQQAVSIALRDAPRNGGDGWRPMADAPKDGKTQIVARHKPNEHTPDGWVATITIDHDDPDEYRRGGLDTIKHYNGETLMSGFHGVWIGWMYPHEVGRGVSAPPSPNAGDETQDSKEDHR